MQEPLRLVAVVQVDAEDRAVLELAGEIDLATAGVLADHLDRVVETGVVHVVLDTRKVEFADSTFVSAIIRARDAVAPRGGSVSILAPPPPIRRLIDVTAISTLPGIVVVDA